MATSTKSNEKRTGLPTTGALEWRSAMFPVRSNAILDTIFGEVKFEKGQLNSRDRDFIDAIMTVKEKAVINASTGELTVVFDQVKLKKILNIAATTKWAILYNRFVDIHSVVLSIRRPGDDWPTTFSLISSVGDMKTQSQHGGHKFDGPLKKVVFTKRAVALLIEDTQLFVNPSLVKQVLGLRHQISRAIARWCLSHTGNQSPFFDDLFQYVGASGASDRQRKRYVEYIREDATPLKDEKKDEFSKIGITFDFDQKQLFYTRNKGVFIQTYEAQNNKRQPISDT